MSLLRRPRFLLTPLLIAVASITASALIAAIAQQRGPGRGAARPEFIPEGYDDHQNMMEQLGIKALRPGKSGGNQTGKGFDEATANEWLATLPASMKIRGQEGKYLLKKAMEPSLPSEILYRPKMGFAVPLARWFRGPLRQRVRDSLLGDRLAATGYFDRAYLERLVHQHESERFDHSAPLWTLLMFDAFLRSVLDQTDAAPRRLAA